LTKLYLDIDGVLLTTRHMRAADDAALLIRFITSPFDCYWLTTHCKGDTRSCLAYLAPFLDADTLERLRQVKPTDWDTLKTEAIDLTSDFVWLDDSPLESEKRVLAANNASNGLIVVNLSRDGELRPVIDALGRRLQAK
jgi:hypothetical protein